MVWGMEQSLCAGSALLATRPAADPALGVADHRQASQGEADN